LAHLPKELSGLRPRALISIFLEAGLEFPPGNGKGGAISQFSGFEMLKNRQCKVSWDLTLNRTSGRRYSRESPPGKNTPSRSRQASSPFRAHVAGLRLSSETPESECRRGAVSGMLFSNEPMIFLPMEPNVPNGARRRSSLCSPMHSSRPPPAREPQCIPMHSTGTEIHWNSIGSAVLVECIGIQWDSNGILCISQVLRIHWNSNGFLFISQVLRIQ